MRTYAKPYEIFKSKGCAKFSPIPPRIESNGEVLSVSKKGAILLEVASVKMANGQPIKVGGNLSYDWENKISFAIGIADITRLLDDQPKLIHDMDGIIKTLQFTPGTERFEGTYLLHINEKGNDGNRKSASVPFSGGEYALLMRLLVESASQLLGWPMVYRME